MPLLLVRGSRNSGTQPTLLAMLGRIIQPAAAAGRGHASSRAILRRHKSAWAGDAGRKATHYHHHMTTFLAVSTPLYMLAPSSLTDGAVDKVFGLGIAASVAGHSWIGMSYVATDYVPKVSKGLVGPVRVFNAALAGITLLGLGKVALNDRGGIKGMLIGLWRPVEKEGSGEVGK